MPATARQCPEPDSLAEFLQGAMPEDLQDGIREHVDSCQECLRVFAALASQHFSQHEAGAPTQAENLALAPGESVGRFVVLHPVGRGGMGRVYAVYDPELDRKVALKLLHQAGPAANRVLMREARLVAKVSHPNVISIYEVGNHRDAVYMAMEFVEGPSPLAHFEGATTDDVVRYFHQVGLGLCAAHERGIVHRDVKPANLLLADDGRAVIADFGLAATDTTRKTLVGTPAYMAPEQASGDATPLSDQYSFCVSLLQVLTGHLHRCDDPLPKETPSALRSVLTRGLQPDPARRFASMKEVCEALEPKAPSRSWALATAVVALAGIAGVFVAMRGASTPAPCSDAERHLAGVWNANTEAALQERFDALPGYGDELWVRARDRFEGYRGQWLAQHKSSCEATRVHKDQSEAAMDRQMQCLEERRTEFAGIVSALQAVPLEDIARVTDAQALLAPPTGCATPDEVPDLPAVPSIAASVTELRAEAAESKALAAMGQLDSAAANLAQLLTRAKDIGYLPLQSSVALSLANVLSKSGKHQEAEALYRSAIALGTESRHDSLVADAWLQLSWLHGYHQERYADAESDLENGRAFTKRLPTPGVLPMIYARNRGWIALRQGDLERALSEYQHALTLASEHPEEKRDIAMLHSDVGSAYLRAGEIDKAASQFALALQGMTALVGPRHPDTLSIHNNYAVLLKEQGNIEQAILEFKKVLAGFRASMKDSEVYEGQALNNLATIYADQGDNPLAESTYREALEAMKVAYPDGQHANIARALQGLATVVHQDNRLAEAEALHERSLHMKEALLGPDHPSVAISLSGMAMLYEDSGRLAEARSSLQRALAILTKSVGAEHAQTQFVAQQLADLASK